MSLRVELEETKEQVRDLLQRLEDLIKEHCELNKHQPLPPKGMQSLRAAIEGGDGNVGKKNPQ